MARMVHCLGLLAKAGHGKTTAARFLAETYGARIVSLATPLKRAAQKVMKFSDEQLWGTQEQKDAIDPRYGFSARYFLQSLGTEGLREEFWPSIHLDAFERSLERQASALPYQPLFVCDDVRFKNEVEFLACPTASRLSAVIKIVCSDAPEMPGGHSSEAEIDSIPPEHIVATVLTSRALGTNHLTSALTKLLVTRSPFHILLQEGRGRVSPRAA